jgi:hypothetical protein
MPLKYSETRATLRTGDLVLFSGRGTVSNMIKYGTLSNWSHCGMVVKMEQYDFITIWESTTLSNIPDLESEMPLMGVQLVPLSERLKKYDGDVAIRRLKGGELSNDDINKLMLLRKQLKGKRYELSKMELFKAAYDGPFGANIEDLSSIFCSELVAEAYQSLGLLDDVKASNEYTPADFSEKRMKNLLGDFYLSEEELITNDEL